MPPKATVAHLRLLSLALDDALAREDLDEAFTLLDQREQCIAALKDDGITIETQELAELMALNERLARRLRAGQTRMAETARAQAKAVQAAKAYSR